MAEKSFKVTIGGIEYKLTGDNEDLLRRAASEVDTHFSQIREQYSVSVSVNTLSVLSALNIAENKIKSEEKLKSDSEYLKTELNRMCDTLEQVLK
ncbi:MAG: cell division protein ZapA [Desulfobulbaceae bacterium]|nr:cell division protein ZapA [Desulfobulbaceae bacterium]